MQFILTLLICSYVSGTCLTPYQWPSKFNDVYDCLNFGYKEALQRSEALGREEVNKVGIYIRFSCIPDKGLES